jgi:hypothetical protein
MFVEAEIVGRTVEGIYVIPRAALRVDDRVLVVDGEDRLRLRGVEILRTTRDDIVVRSGLSEGERICLSALAAVTDGMKVRISENES